MDQWWVVPAAIIAVAVAGGAATLIYWMGQVQEHRGSVSKFMSEIRGDMQEIRNDIKKIFQRLPAQAVVGNSPRQLTDFGEKIADNLKALDWATSFAPTLLSDEVRQMPPFRVDEFATQQVLDLGSSMEARIAACADEFGTNRDNVRAALQVVLRDELLRLRGDQPSAT